jgi:hypothetical protein
MNGPLRTICLVSLAMLPAAVAGAQAPSPFDGTYAGVANTATGGTTACTPFAAVPQPLTIRNGVARFTGGFAGHGEVPFEGSVSPQGELRLKDNLADLLLGRVDASGRATGSVNIGSVNCVLTAVWQKQ